MKAKKLMLILLCTTVVGAFTACGAKSSGTDGAGQNESNVVSEEETNAEETDDENTQIAGFSFEVPKQIEGYPNQAIQAIEDDSFADTLNGAVFFSLFHVLCKLSDIAGQHEECDQVGDDHKAVEGIGNVP